MSRRHCKKCEKAGFDPSGECCAYCDAALSTRHEHDHFPVPRRHGGEDLVPVCLNCHDLKDRINFSDWDVGEAWAAVSQSPPVVKLLCAKLVQRYFDEKARVAK